LFGILRRYASATSGIILYDADKILDAASADREQDLYKAHLDLFVDPFDPNHRASQEGRHLMSWIEAAQKSADLQDGRRVEDRLPAASGIPHLPMIWYVPPLSPVQSQIDQKKLPTESDGVIPKAEAMRLPVKYLANLLTAGKEDYIVSALNRLIAMRSTCVRSTSRASRIPVRWLPQALPRTPPSRCTATWRSPITKTVS
jgi:nitrate reductase beta subunit